MTRLEHPWTFADRLQQDLRPRANSVREAERVRTRSDISKKGRSLEEKLHDRGG